MVAMAGTGVDGGGGVSESGGRETKERYVNCGSSGESCIEAFFLVCLICACSSRRSSRGIYWDKLFLLSRMWETSRTLAQRARRARSQKLHVLML